MLDVSEVSREGDSLDRMQHVMGIGSLIRLSSASEFFMSLSFREWGLK